MDTVRVLSFLLLSCLPSAFPQATPEADGGQVQSGGVGNEPVQIMALGRPFSLGMFYDSRSDKLVPGLTLWDKDKLASGMTVTSQPNTEFNIVASESVSEKLSSLGVEASLKASFLCGLVSVEGSAKYLKDDKKSSKQARVTLKYKTTTVFKALSMDQLGTGNLEHSEVIEKGLATHVVTGILYGAQAFFVFNQETSEGESIQDIQGTLSVMIKKIPTVEISGNGSLSMADSEKETVNKFSCTFHGDFRLPTSPTTFEEAVKIYRTLPELLGTNGEHAVPVVVYLLPLSALDSRASKLVRQISIRLVTEAENILQEFTDLEMWSNDVLTSPAGQKFPQVSKNIKNFKALCTEFKSGLQRTLAQKLPSIRGGGEGETALAEVLEKVAQSPFNRERLNQWMEDKDDQVETIVTLVKLMKNTEMLSSENALTNKVFKSANTLVFVFTFLSSANPFLSELEQYLKNPESFTSDSTQPRRWYGSKDVIDSLRRKAKHFSDFAEANMDRDKRSLQFLALGLVDENHEGSTIHLYEDGLKINDNLEIPSKPRSANMGDISHNSMTLTFSAPSDGAQSIREYRVEFCERGQEVWKHQTFAQAGTVTVTDLMPNTEYSLRVRAVTAVGVGPAISPKLNLKDKQFFKTLPCSPPEDLRGIAAATEVSVYWRKPAHIGQGIYNQSYVVQFRKTQDNTEWMRVDAWSEETVLSGLEPETSYNIRVWCYCGIYGPSKQSATITVTTKDCTKVREKDELTMLQDRLDIMEGRVRGHSSELRGLTSRTSVTENNVATLQRDKTAHDGQIKLLASTTQGQATEIASLKTRTTGTENNVAFLQRDKTALAGQIQTLQANVQAARVAFHVGLKESDRGYHGPFDGYSTLIYRRVFTNIGGHYNKQTGIFRAPVRGVYHFTFACHIGSGSPGVITKLLKNGGWISTADENQSGDGTAGNSAYLSLEVGDQVRVDLVGGQRVWDNSGHYTTFSGGLLFLY